MGPYGMSDFRKKGKIVIIQQLSKRLNIVYKDINNEKKLSN